MVDNFLTLPNARRGAVAVTQYRSVILDTGGNFRVLPVTNANAQRPIGILQDDPAATDEPALVAVAGVCRAEYGGTITRGDTLRNNDNGQLVVDAEVADGSAVDIHHVADALESGASGEIHWVLLHTPVRIGLE